MQTHSRSIFLLIAFFGLLLFVACKEQGHGKNPSYPKDTVMAVDTPPVSPLERFEWTCDREDSLQMVDTTLVQTALVAPVNIRDYFVAYLAGNHKGTGWDFSCTTQELAAFIQFKEWDLACMFVQNLDVANEFVSFRHRVGSVYEEMKLLRTDQGVLVLRSWVDCAPQCEHHLGAFVYADQSWIAQDSLFPAVSWIDFMPEPPTPEQEEAINNSVQFSIGYSLPLEGSGVRAWLNEEMDRGTLDLETRRLLDGAYNELTLIWEGERYVIGPRTHLDED